MAVGQNSSTRLLLALVGGLAAATEGEAAEHGDRCQRNLVCRVHSDKGVILSERKNYAEALAEFQAAYAAEPVPRLLLNIGRSLYRLDRPQEALDYYARFRKGETSLDSETEQTVRRYELDAVMASTAVSDVEPPPAPLTAVVSSRPPWFSLGLLGASLGFFAIGIGLGVGASNAGGELSQAANNYMIFGQLAQNIQSRGLSLQTAGIAMDVIGLLTLSAGASSLGTWFYIKQYPPSAAPPTTARANRLAPTAALDSAMIPAHSARGL